MTTNPLERSYSLEVAESTLMSELDKLGYQYKFKLAGNSVHACKCTIEDKITGDILASGNGKGDEITSRVGSLFEATEHLFSDYHSLDANAISFIDISDFCRDNSLCNTLPLATLKNVQSTAIPFLKHKAVHGQNESFYPLGLACPNYLDLLLEDDELKDNDSFNYARLEQYSSNSGTAIGMNAEEAIIHGLLEGIERTSLSKFLTNAFLLNKRGSLRVIDPVTLPPNLQDVFERTEKELGSRVLTFEMPNQFGIPAYCCWMEQHQFRSGIVGFGCSLSREHAILRSLYEVAQYFLLSKHVFGFEWLANSGESNFSQLTGLPFHQKCVEFDLGLKCKELGYEFIDYKDLAQLQFSSDPQDYLRDLTNIVYAKGEVPYATTLNVLGSGINISHTFITGEDRFFNVKNGKSTFPVSL
jgi:ribosomal protein S12 methylthiotransferase accessory factor